MIKKTKNIFKLVFTILVFLSFPICFANGQVDKQKDCNPKCVNAIVKNDNEKNLINHEEKINTISEDLINLKKRIQTHEKDTDCAQLKKDILTDYLSYSGYVVTSIAVILTVFGIIVTIILAIIGTWGVWYLRRIVSNFNELGSAISIAFYRKSASDFNNRAVDSFNNRDHLQAVSYSKTALKMLEKSEKLDQLRIEKKGTLVLKDIISFFGIPSDEKKQYREVMFKSNLAFYYARIQEKSMALDAIEWVKKGKDLGIKRNDISLIDSYLYVLMNYQEFASVEDIEEGKKVYQEYQQNINDHRTIPPTQKTKFSKFFGDGSYSPIDYQI